MTDYFQPLLTGTYYHLYNRGNNGDKLFYLKENYYYFLRKFDEYLSPYFDVYSYCLLPNHFHFLIKTKELEEIDHSVLYLKSGLQILNDPSRIMSEVIRRFFLSYAKSIKIQEGRTGSLFEKNVKRKQISNDQHLLWLINYIHRNPVTHGYVRNYTTYPFSSYASLLSNKTTKLKRELVFPLFGGREDFIQYHATNPVLKDIDDLTIE